jgi:uncharacterized protein YbcI
MATETEPQRQAGNTLYAAISNAIVRCMRDYTGRGPMKARTTIRDNVVVVMLEQTLTKGEQVLLEKGRGDNCSPCATNTRKRCARKAAKRSPSSPDAT